MKILVSACLLGRNCKYSGGNNYNEKVIEYLSGHEVIPVCPEVYAGMPTPRTPIEIRDGQVVDRDGNNVDQQMRTAVASLLSTLPLGEVSCAILQQHSPSCGVKEIYDGTFSGKLIPGQGVFAQALKDAGVKVIDSSDF
ncbi:MAG: DUF523 domain-containing protein [Clostridiales bacterium]|nr:DUF523 domain-containing protein [Clostridiales bacterium]